MVELVNLGCRQGEAEDSGILGDAGGIGQLGDDHDAVLDVPADHDLGRADTMRLGDSHEPRMAQVGRLQRTVPLKPHAATAMSQQDLLVEERRAPFDLVHRQGLPGGALELVDLRQVVVAGPDGACVPCPLDLQESLLSRVAKVVGTFQAPSCRASSGVKEAKNSWTASTRASMEPCKRLAATLSLSRHQIFSTGLCLCPP